MPRSEWRNTLLDTTVEIFSTMAGANVSEPASPDYPVLAYVTGVVGITGIMTANFTLRCSDRSAILVTSQMLGTSIEEAAAQKCDAIGEVCNMVAGHFKLKIGYGGTCDLTLPSVIVGSNYRISSRAPEERLEFPVIYEGEPVWLTLDIRK